MRRRWVLSLVLALAASALTSRADEPAVDPYAGAEPRTVTVGGTLDLVVPGVVTQLVCDGVDTLIAVDGDTLDTLHIHGLAPGVAACRLTGVKDMKADGDPDGGSNGNISSFMMYMKITVVAKPAAGAAKPVPPKK